MNNRITYQQIIERLEESSLPYYLLELQNGVKIIVSQRGGRIFGPFISSESESVFWINKAFADRRTFNEFLEAGEWNLGGERMWIAPEIQYTIHDRSDFWGSFHLPEQVDPGNYAIDKSIPGQVRLTQDISLDAYNLASGRKELHVDRKIRLVNDPLRNISAYRELIDGMLFAGYEQVISLSENILDDVMSEAWDLIQVNPGGIFLIPASQCAETTNYYEPIDNVLENIHSNYICLKATGSRRYKVGYKAAHVLGRIAYLNDFSEDMSYLIVRNFFNNPSVPYVEEPADRPDCRGSSIHVYNDDGNFGGFAELECQGRTIGGVTGNSESTDSMILWFYSGKRSKLLKIVHHLLGIRL